MNKSDKKVDPVISQHMSAISKNRKNFVGGFSNRELAKKAGELGKQSQRLKKKNTFSK